MTSATPPGRPSTSGSRLRRYPGQGRGPRWIGCAVRALVQQRIQGRLRRLAEANPFSNPNAPPGPSFMPEYRNPQILQGGAANHEARRISTRARPPVSSPRGTPGRPWCSPLSRSGCAFTALPVAPGAVCPAPPDGGPRNLRARDHPWVPSPLKAAHPAASMRRITARPTALARIKAAGVCELASLHEAGHLRVSRSGESR
jgi:hypothetical protein